MRQPAVVIIGGGLSGIAAAWALARAGLRRITLIERGASLGGLAGSFERNGRFYPLGYHHILHRDHTLLYFLAQIGALDRVRWRRIRMIFHAAGRRYDLTSPSGFMRFPMSAIDKARFAWMMLRASRKSDWRDWEGRSAAELVDTLASPGVRRALFEPLTQLRFEMACREISGAWLGARLHHREGSAPLGYIPHTNWTKTLCDGVTRLIASDVSIVTQRGVAKLHSDGHRVSRVEFADGDTLDGDVFVSTVPTEVLTRLVPDRTPEMSRIRYTALLSAVCTTATPVTPDFYWMNLAPGLTACGLFVLSSLNPTIGAPGETCVNFVTHLRTRDSPLFGLADEELLARYANDFERAVGARLEPTWTHVSRVAMYCPLFDAAWRNPPVRSVTFSNLYFAGNYRTFPSVASTGTALHSGIDTATALLQDLGTTTDLVGQIARFTPPRMHIAAGTSL
jgi:protoporphyrinogen oxidase